MSGSFKTQQTVGSASGSYWSPAHTNASISAEWKTQDNEMISFGHRNHPFAGGPWYQRKQESFRSIAQVDQRRSFGQRYVGGVFIASPISGPNLGLPKGKSESELDAWGTSAIAAVEPTASEWSLATAIGEIKRDGIPDLPGTAMRKEVDAMRRNSSNLRGKGRAVGSEHLNTVFGWAPLKNDFLSFMKAVKDSDDIIRQYKRDSGKKIRRRAGGPPEVETVGKATSFNLLPNPLSINRFGQGYTHIEASSRTWFSGAFVYHLPDDKHMTKVHEYALIARRIHGLEITPEVIWNVSPWTWAADWFGNFGDVMHNVSALGRDGLVMRYGYVMHERKRVSRMNCTFDGGELTREDTDVIRRRYPATPYGFGLSWDGFSSKQLAILGALGLTSMGR